MRVVPQPAVGRHAVNDEARLVSTVIEEIEEADLAVGLRREGLPLVRPEVQEHDLASKVGCGDRLAVERFQHQGWSRLAHETLGQALDVARATRLGFNIPPDGRDELVEGRPFGLRFQRFQGRTRRGKLRIGQFGRFVVVGPLQRFLQPQQASQRPPRSLEGFVVEGRDRIQNSSQKMIFPTSQDNPPLGLDQNAAGPIDPLRFLRSEIVGDIDPPAVVRADFGSSRDPVLPRGPILLIGELRLAGAPSDSPWRADRETRNRAMAKRGRKRSLRAHAKAA